MRKYLSYGVGIDSTAVMLLLIDEGIEFEAVFVDTGCEKPETYEYLDLLNKKGYEITKIIPEVEGHTTLYDYFWHWKIIPLMRYRICTLKFKTQPVEKYIEKPCELMIGYNFNERRRRHLKDRKGITHKFPLIEKKITREQCVKIIRDHDLPVPTKSGCYLCPFQKKRDWKKLRDNYPALFKKA
ncbi:unnamed protein product, partial [marine sediment metagenome]